jgi:F-type H+-transporting ATPase subunit gamma
MATLREIKRRIKAVHSTRQITKAMKMVAASKLRRAQEKMLALRPYADKMETVIASLAQGADREIHPLLAARPRRAVEVVVFTSDRGLCGAFNSNVFNRDLKARNLEIKVSTVGKKAREYYRRRGYDLLNAWVEFSGKAGFADAQEVARTVAERFVSGETDEVWVLYNSFRNVVQQEVRTVKLLPLADTGAEGGAEAARADFIYEPSEEALFAALLPKDVEVQVYRAALESMASEEAARMTAMENATKSCNEMIGALTLKYNKARQASITGELMDIVGGVEALKGT